MSISRLTVWAIALFVSFNASANAELILYDTFDDANLEVVFNQQRLTTAAGAEWFGGVGDASVSLIPGGIRMENRQGVASLFRPAKIDGINVTTSDGWSIRSLMSLDSGEWGGVATNNLSYALLNGARRRLAAGSFNAHRWADPLDPIFDTNYYVQLNYFDDLLTGYVWPENDSTAITSVTYDRRTGSTTPALFAWGGTADFFDVRIATTPLLLPGAGGDFNGDAIYSAADVDMLDAAILDGQNDLEFDLNADGIVNLADRETWVKDQNLAFTWFGDANVDGLFNTSDLTTVFKAGKFELDADASWSEGDWTGDGRFDTSDFVQAFKDGGYEVGARQDLSMVPEPSSTLLLALGMLGVCRMRKSDALRREKLMKLCSV